MTESVGVVAAVHRYPVKSMAPDDSSSARIGWNGLAGDRRYAFVRPGAERNGFPWFTIRENARMSAYAPRLVDPDVPERSAVVVRTPAGAELDVTDAALAAELGDGVQVIRIGRGVFDSLPVSVISTATIEQVCTEAQVSADPLRFRPNLVIETSDGLPFGEERWLGRELRVGSAVLRWDRRDPRCVIVNLDPMTGARDARILKWLGLHRETCAGLYGSVVLEGEVGVGNEVLLL